MKKIREFLDLAHDKEYFHRLKVDVKFHWKLKILMYIGLALVITSTMLNIYTKLINSAILIVAWLVGYGIVYLALWRIAKLDKAIKRKETDRQKVNPISLGTLYFAFALPLWTYWSGEQKAQKPNLDLPTLITAIVISLITFFFFLASYSEPLRRFAHRKIQVMLLGLNFIAFLAGFVLGWLPTFAQVHGIVLYFVVFVGFAWVVTILLGLIEQLKNGIVNIAMLLVFFAIAGTKFFTHNAVGIWSGCILLSIGVLIYLVSTRRLNVYKEVLEQR